MNGADIMRTTIAIALCLLASGFFLAAALI